MPELSVGDLTVAYEIRGCGPPLLMLHGFEGGRHSDDHFTPRLENLFTVITDDQRDCGNTCGADREYGTFQQARDAADFLSALGHERAFIYGQSNGGMIAQALAINHPARVERLVLAVTTPGRKGPAHSTASTRAMRALIDRQLLEPQSPSRFFAPGAFERRSELQEIFNRPRGIPDVERLRRRALAFEGFDSLDLLSTICAPTLVIGAWGDQVIPPASSWAIAERIPGARLIMLDGVGHALTWEAPHRIAPLIQNFFTESLDS